MFLKKNKYLLFIFLTILLVISLAGVFYFISQSLAPYPNSKNTKNFIIRKGQGIGSIADELQKEGLIKNSLIFKVIVKTEGLDKNIQAGSFRLSPSMDAKTIARNLTFGTNDIWVTIPEGLRKEEVAEILIEKLNIDKNEFLEKAREGYLFPDTYLIPRDYSIDQILKLMEDNFQKKVGGLKLTPDLTLGEVIILSSIVEREARHDSDRTIVAGILLKRWQEDWPLEVDATLQYILGYNEIEKTWWTKNLTLENLKYDSPYNTRKYPGLPPSPIASPGLSSIQAVISPQASSYWFYISDKQGTMHYAKTLEEHNQNIAKYLNSVAY